MANSLTITDQLVTLPITIGTARKTKSLLKYFKINLDDKDLTMMILNCRIPFDIQEKTNKINITLSDDNAMVLRDFENQILAEIAKNDSLLEILKIDPAKKINEELVQAKFNSAIRQKSPYPANLSIRMLKNRRLDANNYSYNIFDHNGQPIPTDDLRQCLAKGSTVSVLLQPKIWANGSNCGISFECQQLKILENAPIQTSNECLL